MNENDNNFFDLENCPVRNICARIGNKWAMLIIILLAEKDILRFNEFLRLIPDISSKMLSSTLRNLEIDGLVQRKVYPTVPPKVEYRLTSRGQTLVPHLNALIGWAKDNISPILSHRKAFAKGS